MSEQVSPNEDTGKGGSINTTNELLERIRSILRSPEFQVANETQMRDPLQRSIAKADPRSFLRKHGVYLPEDAEVFYREQSLGFVIHLYHVWAGYRGGILVEGIQSPLPL